MELYKLAQLSYRIGSSVKTKNPAFFYQEFKSDYFYKQMYEKMTSDEIVLFCFLCSQISFGLKKEQIGQAIEDITKNLYSFSIIEVTDVEPYETCDECGGDGNIRCNTCDGEKEISCDTCGGDGFIEGDEDGDESCNECDGSGNVECPDCDGDGHESCGTCDGTGEVGKYGYVSISVEEFISYDSEIFNKIELLNEFDSVTSDIIDLLYNTETTLMISRYHTDTDTLPSGVSIGDYYFGELEKENYRTWKKSNHIEANLSQY